MKSIGIVIGVIALIVLVVAGLYLVPPQEATLTNETAPIWNWSGDSLHLMQDSQEGKYACFGCNGVICKDPAPIMQEITESASLYCDENLHVIGAPVNGLLRTCPDEWIDNQMPGPGSGDTPREYVILDGKRRELAEFDVVWLEQHCFINKVIAY